MREHKSFTLGSIVAQSQSKSQTSIQLELHSFPSDYLSEAAQYHRYTGGVPTGSVIGTSKVVAAPGNLLRDLQVECVVLLPPGGVRGEGPRRGGEVLPSSLVVPHCAGYCRPRRTSQTTRWNLEQPESQSITVQF